VPHSPTEPTWFAELLAASYERLVGEPLAPAGLTGGDVAGWLYKAPFGLLAHDTSADPVFVYANLFAQQCFEYSWEDFVGMPSRLSAEAARRDDRQAFMESVLRQGYAEGYRGVRISKSGRRFWIEDVTLWNLVDGEAVPHGQAALIRRWTPVAPSGPDQER
jgi:hypothetical protein